MKKLIPFLALAFLAVTAQASSRLGPSIANQSVLTPSTVTITGTGSKCLSVDDPTLTVDCTLNKVTAGGIGGLSVTYGVSAATGAFGGGICPSTASVCFNALPLAANAGGYFGGSVGIGTTNPGDKFVSVGGIYQFSGIDTEADETNKNLRLGLSKDFSNNNEVTALSLTSLNSGNTLNIGGGTSAGLAAQTINLYTSASSTTHTGTLAASIISNGNVGIGNTAPTAKLEVTGTVSALNLHSTGTVTAQSLTATDADQGQMMLCISGHTSAGACDATYTAQVRTVAVGTQNQGTLIRHAETAAGRAVLDVENGAGRMLRVDGDSNIYLGYGVGRSTYSPTGGLALSGPLGASSKSVAQLGAITPTAAGEVYYCNNCAPPKLVVSTGTSVANFADIMGGVFQ